MSVTKIPSEKYVLSGHPGVSYDSRRYWHHKSQVREACLEIEELPEEVRDFMRDIATRIISGTSGAFLEMYSSLVDPEKLGAVESTLNDFRTDLEGLRELADYVKS